MRIATHNVEFLFDEGTHEHSGKVWNYTAEHVAARVDELARMYKELNADILFLQEVASTNVLERIIKKIGKKYSYFAAAPDKYGVGNAVLYRGTGTFDSVPATTSMPVFVEGDKDTIGPRIWSRRDFVRGTVTYADKPMHILGIHVKAGFLIAGKDRSGSALGMETQIAAADGLIRSEMFRFAQARKARETVDEWFAAAPDASIVVAGDFNSDERNIPFRVIRGEAAGKQGVLVSATDTLQEARRFSGFSKGRKVLIDHVLVSSALRAHVQEAKIYNHDLEEQEKPVAPNPTHVHSDHAPIVVELREL